MPRKKTSLINDLILAPFWVSLIVAAVAYILLGAILPGIQFSNPIFKGIAAASRPLAPLAGLFFIFISLISLTRQLRIKKQLKQQTTPSHINFSHFAPFRGKK